MLRRFSFILVMIGALLYFRGAERTTAKVPAWQAGEHPRLIATAAEQPSIAAKLTSGNTTSAALWQYFATHNASASTGGTFINYADAGVMYWVTGTASYGQRAHDAVMNYVNNASNVFSPYVGDYNLGFWQYRDMLLNYDFAYDQFSPAERQTILTRILLQGVKCHAGGSTYAPGNINGLWGLCEYASAVMLEGENFSTTITDEAVTRQASGNDTLTYPMNVYSITVTSAPGGGTTYVEGVDYTTCANQFYGSRCINWSPAGAEPSAGTLYYVSYTVTPQIDQWRLSGKTFIEDQLNYQWRDGSYSAGFHPYSGAILETLIDMMEIAKRDLGIDYSQNVDLKRYIDMALYERLPNNVNAYPGYRYDTRNDAGTWGEDPINHPSSIGGYRGWVRRMAAWGMSKYGSDPVYAAKYLWFWGQWYRNANGTVKAYNNGAGDWREALYFNDALVSSYPVTTLPTPNWPTYRFFRGRDYVIARTDRFGAYNPDAAYVSLLATNHNHQVEHDQGDSGSFTFYSNREDWAIDPGYQQGNGAGANLYDHNTVGIDGGGYAASGIYGQPNTVASLGGFSHVERVALTDGASAMKADLSAAWSLTATPYINHQYRYLAMVNGGPTSYLVIGDDIQKDNSTHTYQWYLQNAPGNNVIINGATTTITGARGQAKLDIVTVTPSGSTASAESWTAGNIYPQPYQRLTVNSPATVNPYFLHLLIPTPTGQTKPTTTTSAVTGGAKAVITWPGGTLIDTVYWKRGSATIVDGSTSTDAQLTILRENNGLMQGLMVFDGRTVTRNGTMIFEALDGQQGATFSSFDTTAAISGADVSRVRVRLPDITSAHIEDGLQTVDVAHDDVWTYLTAPLPFDAARHSAGQLYRQDFSSSYEPDLVVTNIEHFPVTDQAVTNGVLDLRATAWDYISRSKRDSTVWRRTGHTPSIDPPDTFGDARYQFRFRFTNAADATRRFRAFFRVADRESSDWNTNQNYLRLDFNPTNGQVSLGQRWNGAWSSIDDNLTLTATTATGSGSFNDTNWHTVSLEIEQSDVRIQLDGQSIITGTLSQSLPARGYLQWQVVGTSHVQLDDFLVTAFDHVAPVAPSDGQLTVDSQGHGLLNLLYNRGRSSDSTSIWLYESASPIAPTDNPAGLTLLGSSVSSVTTLTTATINLTQYHAVAVHDTSGNVSQLLPLTIDVTPPAAVIDLVGV